MEMLRHARYHGQKAIVDLLSGGAIEKDSPFSPDIPHDLRSWLPDLFDRFPLVFPWDKPKPVDPALHTVWLLDNTAFRPKKGDNAPEEAAAKDANYSGPGESPESNEWQVEFVACYFIKNSGKDLSKLVSAIVKELHLDENDAACKDRIAKRLQPFVDTILPKRTVQITIGDAEERTLGPSSYSGISSGLHTLPSPALGNITTSHPTSLPPPFSMPCTTRFYDNTGYLIISDIDDTIKFTQSPSPTGIIHNTFVTPEFEPIDGMPALYAHLSDLLDSPPFFYLSASPYNLYPLLHRFVNAHYPSGTLILRDASWQNLVGGLIASLQRGTKAYKVERIRKIHSWFPDRKIICIGDSTQTDPEAYGDIAREFKGWVKGVFVRKVSCIAGMDEKTKNSDERFGEAFKGLEGVETGVFENAEDVRGWVDGIVKAGQRK